MAVPAHALDAEKRLIGPKMAGQVVKADDLAAIAVDAEKRRVRGLGTRRLDRHHASLDLVFLDHLGHLGHGAGLEQTGRGQATLQVLLDL